MASKKEGETATLGTFAIDLQLKIDYKVACMEQGVSMTDELTAHIKRFVARHKQAKLIAAENAKCGSESSTT